MSFMENHNLNLTATLSPSSTQNEPEVTNEEVMQTNNNVVTEAVGVDAGSDTGGKSEAGGSGQGVKRGRGRPRKNGNGGNQLALVSSPPPPLAIQDCGSDGKRGRGRPRGSGKLQILASIGEFLFRVDWFVCVLHEFFVFVLFVVLRMRREVCFCFFNVGGLLE